MANCWKFLHDPDVYRDPFTFNPDRYAVSIQFSSIIGNALLASQSLTN